MRDPKLLISFCLLKKFHCYFGLNAYFTFSTIVFIVQFLNPDYSYILHNLDDVNDYAMKK